jgi:hypothetical protein
MIDRGERREEIKLILEYAKLVLSLIGIVTLVFAGLQWRDSNRAASLAGYQNMAVEWRDHIRTFVDKPDLRPYFEEGLQLNADDPNREAVLALADVRLDVMDAVLTYPALLGYTPTDIQGWRNTFASAFRASPALCARMHQTKANYGLVVPIGVQTCTAHR